MAAVGLSLRTFEMHIKGCQRLLSMQKFFTTDGRLSHGVFTDGHGKRMDVQPMRS
jgi:hypothetical protein